MTEERLAQRYGALLAFYPRWYRDERGAELVGTLLDAARPGQARPTWREVRAMGNDPRTFTDHRLEMLSVVALVGAAVLWRKPPRRARAGRGMLAFAVVLPVLLYVPGFLLPAGPVAADNVIVYLQVLPVALFYLGALGYVAVDPRPALAVAIGGVSYVVEVGAVLAVLLVAAAVAVGAAALGLRRQLAVLPTRIGG